MSGGGSRSTRRYSDALTEVADDLVYQTLLEGKAPALRASDPVSKLADAKAGRKDYKQASNKAFKKYRAQMLKRRKSLERELTGMMDTWASGRGKLAASDVKSRVRNKLQAAYINAFELGLRAAGLTGFQDPMSDATMRKRIESSIAEELKHLDKLLSSVDQGKLRGSPVQRIKNYGESVESAFNQGRVMAAPSLSLFYWHLESGNPCPDCVLIAKHSPYTRETLPTVPKAGSTRCLNHCYCSLETEPTTERKVEQVRRRHLTRKQFLAKLRKQQKRDMGRSLV